MTYLWLAPAFVVGVLGGCGLLWLVRDLFECFRDAQERRR